MLALAAVTRVPLVNLSLGESDGARYLIGLEQWLREGHGAPFVYAHELSPGYYALGAWLTRASGAGARTVLDAISLVAALAAAPLLFWIGSKLTTPAAAAAGTAVFLLAPGYWWLGLEPHPQQASFLLLLLALACCLPRSRGWGWRAAAAACFGAGLLLKNDLVLLGGIFPALELRNAGRDRWRRAVAGVAVPAAGLAIFFAGRQAILAQGWNESQRQTLAAIRQFFELPHGTQWLKQGLPFVFAGGLATAALIASGLLAGVRTRAWRRRWGWLLAAWVLPGTVFWLLMQGNSARHVAPYLLLPLWAGCEALERRLRAPWRHGTVPVLAGLAVATVGLNWAAVPANSNVTLYPSANVYGSAADLARRTADMKIWLDSASGGACYLGNGTLPYLEWARLAAQPGQALAPAEGVGGLRTDYAAAIGGDRFLEVNTPAQFRAAAALCGADSRSLEFTASGLHRRFLGQEWAGLPFARRWYPAPPAAILPGHRGRGAFP